MTPTDMKNEYEDWYAQAEDLVTLARAFYRWAPFPMPGELERLEELMELVKPPPEFEPDMDDDWRRASDGVYWTIDRMFEDL